MAKNFYRIGLTGGIGSGKSEVRKQIAAHGIATIDADSLAKKIAAEDTRAISAIRQAFGDEVYSDSGELQRQKLASKVFGNPEALAGLNAILHPLVFEYVDREAAVLQARGQSIVVIEAALFYESGWDVQMDFMVVVTAPMEKRAQWLHKRDGANREQIEARVQHQMPVEEKAKRSDYLIENAGTLDELSLVVSRFVDWLRMKVDE